MKKFVPPRRKKVKPVPPVTEYVDNPYLLGRIDELEYSLLEKEEEIDKLNKELFNANLYLEGQRKNKEVGDIKFTSLAEYESGELKNCIYQAVSEKINNTPEKFNRTKDILSEFLVKNNVENESLRLASFLKESKKVKDVQDLEEFLLNFGFVKKEESKCKHSKYSYFGDDRYLITVASTGSDYREIKNTLADIKKMLF